MLAGASQAVVATTEQDESQSMKLAELRFRSPKAEFESIADTGLSDINNHGQTKSDDKEDIYTVFIHPLAKGGAAWETIKNEYNRRSLERRIEMLKEEIQGLKTHYQESNLTEEDALRINTLRSL